MRAWLRPIATLAAILGAILFNGLSNRYPPNGETVADLSNTLFAPVLMIPAGYAFAIWGLIYLGLIALGCYQLPPAQHQNPKFHPHTYFLVLASLAQCLWIYLFLTRQFGLSVLAMVEILLFLVAFYLRIHRPRQLQHLTTRDRWLLYRPLSLYLGWISVATIVNVASALSVSGWGNWGIAPEIWTAGMMAIATLIGTRLLVKYSDITYALVLVWAFVAIALKHLAIPLITTAGLLFSVLLLGLCALRLQPRLR